MILTSFNRCFLSILLALGAVACSYQQRTSQDKVSLRQTTDGLGRKVSYRQYQPGKPLRVMAMSPALTEMLFATLPDSEIIAVSTYCNYPAAQVAKKPKVNSYPPDLEALAKLNPDIVFAEEGIISPDVVAKLERLNIPVYMFKYSKLADVWNAIDTLGVLTGHTVRAQKLSDSLRMVESALREKARMTNERPSILGLISNKPIYVWGTSTILTDMLEIVGATNAITEDLGKAYPELTREYTLKTNPDWILGGTITELDSSFFSLYPELKAIKAYKRKQMFNINNDILTRPGPRSLQAVEAIMNAIHDPNVL